jgi:FtsH-binding integral membrane protein
MAFSENSRLLDARGRARVAAWASVGLYLVAVVMWARSSLHSPRGTASAFATDLTGLALWGSLLVVFVVLRRYYPRPNAYLAQIVLGLVTLFSATQVVLDVTHRH